MKVIATLSIPFLLCSNLIWAADPIKLNKKESIGAAADSCVGGLDAMNTVKAISDCERMLSAATCALTGRVAHAGTAAVGRSAHRQFSNFIDSQNKMIREELAKDLGDDYHEAWRRSYSANASKQMVNYKGQQMTREAKELAVLKEHPDALRGKSSGVPNMKFSGDLGKWVDIASYSNQDLERIGAKDLAGRNTNAGISTMEKIFNLNEIGKFNLDDPKTIEQIAEANHQRWLSTATDKEPSMDKPWKDLSEADRKHNVNQVKSITDRFKNPISRSLGKGSAAIVYSSAANGRLASKAITAIGKKVALGVGSLGVGVGVEALTSATPTACSSVDESMIQTDDQCKAVLIAGPKVDEFLSGEPAFQKEMLRRPAVCKFYNNLADKMLDRERKKAQLAKSLGSCQGNVINLMDGSSEVKYSFTSRGSLKDVQVVSGTATQQFKIESGNVRVRTKNGTRWGPYRDLSEIDQKNAAYKKPIEYLGAATAAAAKRSKGCQGDTASSPEALEEAR